MFVSCTSITYARKDVAEQVLCFVKSRTVTGPNAMIDAGMTYIKSARMHFDSVYGHLGHSASLVSLEKRGLKDGLQLSVIDTRKSATQVLVQKVTSVDVNEVECMIFHRS